jgi:hypothetical protein
LQPTFFQLLGVSSSLALWAKLRGWFDGRREFLAVEELLPFADGVGLVVATGGSPNQTHGHKSPSSTSLPYQPPSLTVTVDRPPFSTGFLLAQSPPLHGVFLTTDSATIIAKSGVHSRSPPTTTTSNLVSKLETKSTETKLYE